MFPAVVQADGNAILPRHCAAWVTVHRRQLQLVGYNLQPATFSALFTALNQKVHWANTRAKFLQNTLLGRLGRPVPPPFPSRVLFGAATLPEVLLLSTTPANPDTAVLRAVHASAKAAPRLASAKHLHGAMPDTPLGALADVCTDVDPVKRHGLHLHAMLLARQQEQSTREGLRGLYRVRLGSLPFFESSFNTFYV
jgi:hypothetical protein